MFTGWSLTLVSAGDYVAPAVCWTCSFHFWGRVGSSAWLRSSVCEVQRGGEAVIVIADCREVVECADSDDAAEVPDVLEVENESLPRGVVADSEWVGVVTGGQTIERERCWQVRDLFLAAVVGEGERKREPMDQ
jgi:hypothetical protein